MHGSGKADGAVQEPAKPSTKLCEMPGMLNCDGGMLTCATLKDIMERPHSLGMCAFLDFTVIQCNMAHVFLAYYGG